MSQYFSFHLATKDEEGNYHYYAPMAADGSTISLLTASRSFIHKDDFINAAEELIPIDKMDATIKSFGVNSGWNDKEYSVAYAISIDALRTLRDAGNSGFCQGYVTREELVYIKHNNYFLESAYDVDLVSAEEQAEHKDDSLYHVAFIDTTSSSFHAAKVLNFVYELWNVNNLYVIFDTEY